MRSVIYVLSFFAVAICFSNMGLANEHPPHGIAPGEALAEEHPSAPVMLSSEAVIKGIKDHISNVTKANAGYFVITDPVEGKVLRLQLVRVHEDKVSYLKKDSAYFACSDFMNEDGTAYDLDFWMKKGAGNTLSVYETKIHKKEGVPRFTYKDDEIVPVE